MGQSTELTPLVSLLSWAFLNLFPILLKIFNNASLLILFR